MEARLMGGGVEITYQDTESLRLRTKHMGRCCTSIVGM